MSRVTQQYVDCLVKTVVGPPVSVVSASDVLALAQVAQPVESAFGGWRRGHPHLCADGHGGIDLPSGP